MQNLPTTLSYLGNSPTGGTTMPPQSPTAKSPDLSGLAQVMGKQGFCSPPAGTVAPTSLGGSGDGGMALNAAGNDAAAAPAAGNTAAPAAGGFCAPQ